MCLFCKMKSSDGGKEPFKEEILKEKKPETKERK